MGSVGARLEVVAIPGVPRIAPGDDLVAVVRAALAGAGVTLQAGDVLVLASKLVSKAEGRFVDLSTVTPSVRASSVAQACDKDPRLVQCILDESVAISRVRPGVLIVRHRLGIVSANAAIDRSNARPPGAAPDSGPWALLLPVDPDGTAAALSAELGVAIVITDSLGRPFRRGTVGAAVGVAGIPGVWDQRGRTDLDGRVLAHTETGLADQVAAAADLVAGQADEGRGLVLVRGLSFPVDAGGVARDLVRDPAQDLYA